MKMRLLLAIFAAGLLQAADPARSLYQRGLKLAEHGQYDRARESFEMLVSSYPYSPFAAEARDASDAVDLLVEAREHLKTGRPGTARVALQTLVSVYPETPLAQQARQEIRKADENTPLIRAVRFEGFGLVTDSEILDRFREREIGVAPEAVYDPRSVDEAKSLLSDILAARGGSKYAEADVRPAKTHRVEITFRAVAR
jgi:tetratricopeptide (TPR) repeat protein